MDEPKWTPGPWKASRRNWLGEDSGHRIYVHGNEHETYDEDEDTDPEGDSCRIVSTGVAIVEGNAASQQITEANARLIVAAPAMAEAIAMTLANLDRLVEVWGAEGVTRTVRDRLASALALAEKGSAR